MKTNTWMPLYIGDYLRDTMHLSREDHGSYLLLIMAYWNNEGPLPDDPEYLAAVAKVDQTEWQTLCKRLAKFFQVSEGHWRHSRIDRELANAKTKQKARSDAGKAAAEAKKKQNPIDRSTNVQQTLSNGDSTVVQTTTPSPSPSHSTSLEREEAAPSPAVEPLPGFPKTPDEAKQHAAFVGCPEKFAVETWQKAMGRGGRDARDILIRSWRHHLATEWSYDEARRSKAAQQPPQSQGKAFAPSLQQQLNAAKSMLDEVQRQINAIPLPNRDVFPTEYDAAVKRRAPLIEKKRQIKARMDDIQAKLANGGSPNE